MVPLRLPGQGSRLRYSSEVPAAATEPIRPATVSRVQAHPRVTTELPLRKGPIRNLPLRTDLLLINRPLRPAAAVRHTVARAVPAAVAALTVARVHPAVVRADQ